MSKNPFHLLFMNQEFTFLPVEAGQMKESWLTRPMHNKLHTKKDKSLTMFWLNEVVYFPGRFVLEELLVC